MEFYDASTSGPAGKRTAWLFRFHDAARLDDVPYIEEGPEVSDAAIDDFLDFHPGFDDADDEVVEEQLWELVDDLLDADDREVVVSRSPRGEWGLVSRRPYGYSVLLSADGAVVVAYSTTQRVKTYGQALRDHAQQKALRTAERERKLVEERERRALRVASTSLSGPSADISARRNRARARNFVHAVVQGQVSEEEARRRAKRKGCRAEFDALLQHVRGGEG